MNNLKYVYIATDNEDSILLVTCMELFDENIWQNEFVNFLFVFYLWVIHRYNNNDEEIDNCNHPTKSSNCMILAWQVDSFC